MQHVQAEKERRASRRRYNPAPTTQSVEPAQAGALKLVVALGFLIRGFFLMNAMTFEAALLDLAVKVIDPLPNFKYYFVSGQSHTFMLDPTKNNAPNQPLLGWLTQFVNDDASWKSVKP